MPSPVQSRNNLKRPLLVSAVAHGVLLGAALIAFPQEQRGEPWGGPGGGAIQVAAVRSLPGVPLPRPPMATQTRGPSEVPGRYPTRPQPQRAEERVTQLPRFGEEAQRRPVPPPRAEEQRPLLPGTIPSGEGGPAALPYTPFQLGPSEGALSFGAGGAFGSRYPWYVESVRRRVSGNWLLSTVDPYVQWAPRAVLTFEVLRNGMVVNIQVLRSSGVASVDRSALRAIHDSSPLEPLPTDYQGDKVLVEFWFDFRRQ